MLRPPHIAKDSACKRVDGACAEAGNESGRNQEFFTVRKAADEIPDLEPDVRSVENRLASINF